MEIVTKYNVGDKIFFINKYRKIAEEKINRIDIDIIPAFLSFGNKTTIDIKYFVEEEVIDEEKCFATKEELLKSL